MKLLNEDFIITPEKRNGKLFYKLIFGDDQNLKIIFKNVGLTTAKDGYCELKFKGIDTIEMRLKRNLANLIKEDFKSNLFEDTEEEEQSQELDWSSIYNPSTFTNDYMSELRNRYGARNALRREESRSLRHWNSFLRRETRMLKWENFKDWLIQWKWHVFWLFPFDFLLLVYLKSYCI